MRLLNGGHTANVPASFLAGLDTVAEMMNDEITGRFARQTIKNIILPSVSMDKQMLEDFAAAVIERFQNPFIKHQLLSILLNCTSKFKVRVLPSLLEYQKNSVLSRKISVSVSLLIFICTNRMKETDSRLNLPMMRRRLTNCTRHGNCMIIP